MANRVKVWSKLTRNVCHLALLGDHRSTVSRHANKLRSPLSAHRPFLRLYVWPLVRSPWWGRLVAKLVPRGYLPSEGGIGRWNGGGGGAHLTREEDREQECSFLVRSDESEDNNSVGNIFPAFCLERNRRMVLKGVFGTSAWSIFWWTWYIGIVAVRKEFRYTSLDQSWKS